ncbi:hypothetical protein HYFRA_00005660 [Hymenoscyphus fraxineus]|uniref:Uncharacterized protein n=1 Tax=Hymenoscyphus fraxineus TaxID=746836 RepID=A0A9N9KRM9_9HELO|nr:hypothetical protein HYFRA_00005660 [Hymenoscyphus fraxineus]
MRLSLLLVFVTGVCCIVNWTAGLSALTIYTLSSSAGLWQTFIDKCQEFEDHGGRVRGMTCAGNGIFYLVGAAAAFGAGEAVSMWVVGQGGLMRVQRIQITTPAPKKKVIGVDLLLILLILVSMGCLSMLTLDRWVVMCLTSTILLSIMRLLHSSNVTLAPELPMERLGTSQTQNSWGAGGEEYEKETKMVLKAGSVAGSL